MSRLCRLWDRNFELLTEWDADEPIHLTIDREDGTRWSGPFEVKVVDR